MSSSSLPGRDCGRNYWYGYFTAHSSSILPYIRYSSDQEYIATQLTFINTVHMHHWIRFRAIKGVGLMEGAGVQICRTIGYQDVRVDPFLMLDELRLPAEKAAAGFPSHPHRGFETCTIMKSGKMEHKDSVGNHGVIGPGGVQWMTAGRGIIHSEFPAVTEGDLHGFQLWINLPAKDKMIKPWYQDLQASDIPVIHLRGEESESNVRVMAGEVDGTSGPLKLRNPGLLFDVSLAPGDEWDYDIPSEWNGFCYVYEGSGFLGKQTVTSQHAYIFEREGHEGTLHAKAGSGPLKFLLISGRPINEPIVQYGPFVMNHELEIRQAFDDYRNGRLQNPDDDVWAEN